MPLTFFTKYAILLLTKRLSNEGSVNPMEIKHENLIYCPLPKPHSGFGRGRITERLAAHSAARRQRRRIANRYYDLQ
jgi:hypothetical protein